MSEEPQALRLGYHRDLDAINQKVVRLFALVSEAVAAANEALLGDDTDALAVVRAGEKTIDELMADIEVDIERLLLLQAPVAGELRYALAIIRIVPELERSGDLAEHIAKRAGSGLAAQLTPAARGMIERMGTLTAQLWRAAADAFVDRDPGAGAALEAADDEVDDLHTAADRGAPHRRRAVRTWPPTPRWWRGSTSAWAITPSTSPCGWPTRSPDHAVRPPDRQNVAMATAFKSSNPALNDKTFDRLARVRGGMGGRHRRPRAIPTPSAPARSPPPTP